MEVNNFKLYEGTIYDFSITSKMRGTWFKMLVDAAGGDESPVEEKLVVCKQIRRLHQYFQCGKCKKHFGSYLVSHPPETEVNKTDGLFKWVVKFLNDVNNRIGKELYIYNTLYPMFHTPGYSVCNASTTSDAKPNTSEFVSRGSKVRSSYNPSITYDKGDESIRRSPHHSVW